MPIPRFKAIRGDPPSMRGSCGGQGPPKFGFEWRIYLGVALGA